MLLLQGNDYPDWEFDYFQQLPQEEQLVVQRWVWSKLLRTWRFWAAVLVDLPFTLLSFVAHQLVQAAGGGGFAVLAVWLVGHAPVVWLWNRTIGRMYRSALREFLVALDEHERAAGSRPNG